MACTDCRDPEAGMVLDNILLCDRCFNIRVDPYGDTSPCRIRRHL